MRDDFKKYGIYYTEITNQSKVDGDDEIPVLPCFLDEAPDYLCLYGNPADYNKTNKTCLCFYEYDYEFDGINGLFNAIYYKDKKLLDFYKHRFEKVRFVIEPDYSQVRNIEVIEKKYRMFKARVVGLWFLTEMNIPVIPNLNYSNINSFEYMLLGIKEATMIAVSLKGIMGKKKEEDLLMDAIKYTVDNSKVKIFVVFSTGVIDEKVNQYFEYAVKQGVQFIIPNNGQRLLNQAKLRS
ncbi:MAG: DUF4417 domain-containing protein [bacterium]|nr:DUF4417 domain-containing protein [bacterium]